MTINEDKPVDAVVGLQYGSEGKGKVVAYLANEYNGMVRSGGPQTGHTFYHKKEKYVNRQLPCGVINSNCLLYISANGLVNIDVIGEEIRRYKIYPDRLMVDNNTMVVTRKHIKEERESSLKSRIASTCEGVGAATIEKIRREANLFDHYAFEDPELYFFTNDTVQAINEQIEKKHPILLEGTQGFGLSLHTGGHYPYCTSRDVTTSALLSHAGISPKYHGQTIGVMRTYPIRVGGNSGPTGSDEISWEEVTKRSGSKRPIKEYSSVTSRLRRVFEQDYKNLKRAVLVNKPDQIALMFLDYINAKDYGKKDFEKLSKESKKYVFELEETLDVPITLIGTGPFEDQMIDLRIDEQKRNPIRGDVHKDLSSEFWPANFYNHKWEDGYFESFIDRKLTDKEGNSWERKILI